MRDNQAPTQLIPPPLTAVQLAAQIRDEVARRQDGSHQMRGLNMVAQTAGNGTHRLHAHGTNGTNGFSGPKPLIDWAQVSATLNLAEEHAAAGGTLPEVTRFGGLKRRLVRFVARCVLSLTRFITNRQRAYNITVLNSLRDLVGGVRHLELLQRDALQRVEMEATRRLEALEKAVGQIRVRLPMQEHRVNTLLEEARRRLPGPFTPEQLQALAAEEQHSHDALYVAFEDQFRGHREDIKERLKVYLPVIEEAGVGTAEMPILDVGCGRGEWLELLTEEGLQARGVDTNRALLEQCRQRGFTVAEGDVLEHLRSLPDNSRGAITGFHIIEHLPLDVLIKVLDESVRVLKPGGLVIFETPNPENVLVGSCYFYCDPTHRNPIFPPTIQFIAEQRGLVHVEILRHHDHGWTANPLELLPEEHPLAGQLNPLIELVKSRFFAAADFAVIGRKAGR